MGLKIKQYKSQKSIINVHSIVYKTTLLFSVKTAVYDHINFSTCLFYIVRLAPYYVTVKGFLKLYFIGIHLSLLNCEKNDDVSRRR